MGLIAVRAAGVRAAAIVGTALLVTATACSGGTVSSGAAAADKLFAAEAPASITVTSQGFAEGGTLPDRFTCEGTNISPSLRWQNVPAGTAEVAVVVDDVSVSGGTYVHWIVVAIPANTPLLAEDAVPAGARQTRQSEDRARWRGPCPPSGKGPHTYRFSVYALKEAVPSSIGEGTEVTKALDTIRERVSAKGTLSATFQR